jgi:hypothetical protein
VLAPDTTRESDFHEPHALPDGRGVLFVTHRKQGVDTIELLANGKRRVVLQLPGQSLATPVYSGTGHILFRRTLSNAGLWAVPFSLARLKTTGDPFLVDPAGSSPSVAADGTLAFRLGAIAGERQLDWVDREGKSAGIVGQPELGLDPFTGPALAPDGVRIAIAQNAESGGDIWIYDSARGTKTRLTFEPGDENDPVWSSDGSRIIYGASAPNCTSPGCYSILSRASDGSGVPDTLGPGFIPSITPDGREVIGTVLGSTLDLSVTTMPPERRTRIVERSAGMQAAARVSPSGDYVAYTSNESGRLEVFLKRYPSWEGKWEVSTAGGAWPRWNGAGDRLYYVLADDVYEVEVTGRPSPVLGTPRRLFTLQGGSRTSQGAGAGFDVSANGLRFVVVRSVNASARRSQVVAVENWIGAYGGASGR